MPNVKQMPNRQDAEDLRDAIDARLDEIDPTWRQPTHVGRYIKNIVLTVHECSVIDKPGNSPIAGVVLTPRAEALNGHTVSAHPRTGAPYFLDLNSPQDFDAGGWRPSPDPEE